MQEYTLSNLCEMANAHQCLEGRMLHAIVSGTSLRELVGLAADSLGNPVILIDGGYKLLACSETGGIEDPLWEEILRQGYWSYETVTRFKEERIIDKVVASNDPLLIDWGIASQTRRISMAVKADGAVVGHLAVLEYFRPFVGGEIEQLALVGQVIRSEMQKPAATSETLGLAYEGVIRDLLACRMEEPEEAYARLRTAGWNPPSWLYVLLIDTKDYDPSRSLAKLVRNTVAELLPGAQPIIFRHHIVIVLGSEEGSWSLPPDTLDDVLQLVKKHRMRASISQRFESILDVERYYRQAKSLLTIGARLDREVAFCTYEKYGAYLMVHRCSKHENVEQFCHPVLFSLRGYDFTNQTDYFRTLHAYLMCARSLNAAADRLFIHRNTMRYRMAKIQELMFIDLENETLLSQLYMGYIILEYLGKL